MIPILYEATERNFNTYGLGSLSDVISCYVTEERNGEYELEMTYPISGIHFSEIEKRCFILAKPNYTDDPQPFRIYKISKPLNGICTINAEHISYDMSGYVIDGGLSADGSIEACELLSDYAEDFTITATNTGSAEFSTDVPASVRSWLGGKTGSLLDLYGGEWKWDMFTATLMTARGEDRGVVIRYGKNLLSLEQEEEADNLYTAVIGYWQDLDSGDVVTSEKVETGLTLDTPRVYVYDLTSEFDEEPSEDDLAEKVENYISNNNLTEASVNITLSHSQIGTLSERVDLCDTVTVIHEKLGVEATVECITAVWDVLKGRYDELTFGEATTDIADRIITAEKAAEATQSVFEAAIARVTARITGANGGYIVYNDTDDDGYIDELLIMDSPSISAAIKVWRWNLNGLGYSSTGYDGTYGTAITMDGEIVADYITTGTMYADRIKGGTLTLGGSSNTYGVLSILDADGEEIGSWDRTGITASNASLSGSLTTTSGSSKTQISAGKATFSYNNESLLAILPTTSSEKYGMHLLLEYEADYLSIGRYASSNTTTITNMMSFDPKGDDTGYSNSVKLSSYLNCSNFIAMDTYTFSDVTNDGTVRALSTTFSQTYDHAPTVIAVPHTKYPHMVHASAGSITKTGCYIYVSRDCGDSSDSSDTTVDWIIVYQPQYT